VTGGLVRALALFASDLHGREDRYLKLLAAIRAERPAAVFLGGDLLPAGAQVPGGDFLLDGTPAREAGPIKAQDYLGATNQTGQLDLTARTW